MLRVALRVLVVVWVALIACAPAVLEAQETAAPAGEASAPRARARASRAGRPTGRPTGRRRAAAAETAPAQATAVAPTSDASAATTAAAEAAAPSPGEGATPASDPSADPAASEASTSDGAEGDPRSPASVYAQDGSSAPADRAEADEDAREEDVMAAISDALDEPELGADAPRRDERRIHWRDEWPRYSFDEAVLTIGLGALLVAAELLPNASFTPNWRGGLLFDDGVRSGMRLSTFLERDNARVAADALMWVNMAFPVVVDALLVVGLGDWNWDAAFQMGLISVEAYVVSLVVWRVTALLARRQRPLDTACELGDTSPHCDSRYATQSFFSNHATNAFTGAALTCLHHSSMPVFGDVGWDATACVSSTLLATAVSLLRVMSDHEYLTDVLTGAAIGWVSGFVLPWLLHYQGGARPELRAPLAVIPAPMLGNETYGLQAAGWF